MHDSKRGVDDSTITLRRKLPAHVAEARLAAAADDALHEDVARPRIETVLTGCKLVRQELEDLHRRYADITDLQLTGYSRASAIWLLSGRQLGLLCALLIQIEGGICNEAVVTGRAIHEASVVLASFSVGDEEEVVRIWLDDEGKHGYVRQGAAGAAQDRYETQLAEAMEAAGTPRVKATRELRETLFDHLSRTAHSRRSSCVDSVNEPCRLIAYGWHPSPIWRAGYVRWAAGMTTEVTNVVGDALRALYSQPYFFTETITPMLKSIEAVLEMAPLDEESIRRAAAKG